MRTIYSNKNIIVEQFISRIEELCDEISKYENDAPDHLIQEMETLLDAFTKYRYGKIGLNAIKNLNI